MSRSRCLVAFGLWLTLAAVAAAAPMKALIVDGQNAHNWREATPILKQLLEETGLFTVDVATSPAKGQDMSGFRPDFAAYKLVVLNYQGDDWPEVTQKAFVDYVAGGGGVVCYHFAAAAFPKWKEYNQIIAVGGWGDRTETAGPYLCWRDGQIVRATDPPGKAGFHGAAQTFQVVVRNAEHPITRGLPEKFMHTSDELYCRMRGPAENVTVLATAFAPKAKGGTDEHEPMLMTIDYGKGRVFWTALGHAGEQLKSVAFIATFQRGSEWAATGDVTQKVPADFPTAEKASVRPTAAANGAALPWVVYDGFDGPGKGKHIVLISGDEEYRSEEALPQLGKILAKRHGFKCTVLFAVDPATGTINPKNLSNIPGLEALKTADLMIIFTRFRNLPDEQMRHIVEYVEAGKPILGIRTATHAFNIPAGKKYAKYSWNSKEWEGGFGRQVLGETWISHHGQHGKESTRGLIAKDAEDDPIVRGCDGIWAPTDVYTVRLPLAGDSRPLVVGQVIAGMKPTDKPVEGAKNDPMMPVAWTKTYKGANGQTGRVFTTTMGSGIDFLNEPLRRLLVNAAYWCVGLEDKIPASANVELVGQYKPSPFSFMGAPKAAVRPADHAMESPVAAGAPEGLWQTDFEAARKKAKDEKRLLLVDFTGSDWCGWCMKLKGEVFDKQEFKTEAPKRFVLVELDYPHQKKLPDELKKQNGELQRRYKIRGFPTILVLDDEGKVVAKTGYRPGGAVKYVAHLAGLAEIYQGILKMRAELDKVQGIERAKLLDRLVDAYGKLDNESDELSAWSQEIVSLDADNKAGLKIKHEFRLLMAECAKLKEERKLKEVKAVVAKALALPGLTGRQKQDVYMLQGECCFAQGDFGGLIVNLNQALAAAPESERTAQLKTLIARFKPLADAREKIGKLQADLEKAKGIERAKLLDQLIDAFATLGKAGMKADSTKIEQWSREIVSLDPENKAGLKQKYQFRAQLAEAAKLMDEENMTECRAALEKALVLPGLTGEQIQETNFLLARCDLADRDLPKSLAHLKKARDAAPRSERAPLIRRAIQQLEAALEKQKGKTD